MVELLNSGRHSRYTRADGSLDRSRAVYAAAMSLLGAGVSKRRVAALISRSALRAAVEDRAADGPRWLGFQIEAAARHLAESRLLARSQADGSVRNPARSELP
jgi:hypothetical protein